MLENFLTDRHIAQFLARLHNLTHLSFHRSDTHITHLMNMLEQFHVVRRRRFPAETASESLRDACPISVNTIPRLKRIVIDANLPLVGLAFWRAVEDVSVMPILDFDALGPLLDAFESNRVTSSLKILRLRLSHCVDVPEFIGVLGVVLPGLESLVIDHREIDLTVIPILRRIRLTDQTCFRKCLFVFEITPNGSPNFSD
jgi:hypothetical protein